MLHCPRCGRHYESGMKVCPQDGTPLQADATVAAYIPLDPLIGRVLDDKYRLDERLGIGGMGTVYRATHLLIDRPVAIKVLNTRFVEDEAAQERFRREARAAGRLQHTNAVAVTDFGRTSDGVVYIVMELLEGRDLRDMLTREAPFPPALAVALMAQIAAAVEAAHEAGVIHRDLKPANIFIVERKHAPPLVKVLDFGIAKLAAESVEEAEVHNLTQTGVMIGTPRYMSPEQCDSAKLTPASDVYSLGIIFYEMLTGATPFTGTSPLAVALQHSSKPPPPPRDIVPSIPLALERVVLHALAKRPEARPSDAGAFRRELMEVSPSINAGREFQLGDGSGETIFRAEDAPPPLIDPRAPDLNRQPSAVSKDTTKLAHGVEENSAKADDASALSRAGVATMAAPGAASKKTPRSVSRVQVPVEPSPSRRGRSPVLLTFGLLLLASLIGAVAWVRSRSTVVTPEPSINTNASVAPSPTPTVAPTATPGSEAGRGTEKRPSEARSRRSERAPAQPKKSSSKIGSLLHKAKKIFKNPF